VTILGALIISGGALGGIWLGAVYAAGRITAQLEVQDRWEKERREENSRRVDRQLEHDRKMRDRDELRKMFDEAVENMEETTAGLGELLARRGVIKLVNQPVHEQLMAQEYPAGPPAVIDAAIRGMGRQHHRLRLRLWGKELPQKYWNVRSGVIEILKEVGTDDDDLPEATTQGVREKWEVVLASAGQFVKAAAEHLGN
jgi:hypothetical protein